MGLLLSFLAVCYSLEGGDVGPVEQEQDGDGNYEFGSSWRVLLFFEGRRPVPQAPSIDSMSFARGGPTDAPDREEFSRMALEGQGIAA